MKNTVIFYSLIVIFTSLQSFTTMTAAASDLSTSQARSSAARIISVTGYAERQVSPNLAYITLAVEERGMPLDTIRRQVNDSTAKILRALQTVRLAAHDIDSSSITIRPEFSYERTGGRRFEGYVVNRQIRVTLRELADLGAVIERSLEAGANQISDPIFDHSQRADIERSVLSAATDAARRNAIAAAKGVNVTVGAPVKIVVQNDAALPRVNSLRMAAMEATPPETSYEPGMLTFRVTVTAEFEMLTSTL